MKSPHDTPRLIPIDDEFSEPHMPRPQFLSDEPPRPKREPGDGWKVLVILALTAVMPLVVIGCVAIFGRHS